MTAQVLQMLQRAATAAECWAECVLGVLPSPQAARVLVKARELVATIELMIEQEKARETK